MPFKYQPIDGHYHANPSELVDCSNIGVDVLKEGGTAVDAAIATEICVGTINAFSAGIGGGGIMIIRLPNGTSEFIDSRETAPLVANKNMFVKDPISASVGGLSFRDQVAHEARIQEIMSKEYATSVRANISDNETFPPLYYNPMYDQMDDHGTTHVSVLDINDMAVSFTSTVYPVTGILLNDEMDDFSIPGRPNAFGLFPSPYNYAVPAIVENEDGNVELVAGGSGGTKILSAVFQVLLHNVEDRGYSCQVHAVRKLKDGTIHGICLFKFS
ncbi:18124_t:CDS:2 [Racocetra fulgida]|uniref:18124_t:CDS:1 n=1 Tax=Racocetra fulgida TaxID=60492 RepID=A0A9N8Z5F6_9GLOM|nr:18124_t:CDS:2 [Racocetra fulgida]